MGFPDESNTGVPAGVTLTPSGRITINTAGAVVSGLNITGDVVITAVTLVNCRVAATSWGRIVAQAPGAVIENCEVFQHLSERNNTKGVLFDDPASCVDAPSMMSRMEYISPPDIAEDNYIHDLNRQPHYGGIQLHGGVTSDVTIRHTLRF
jgi:hypothetical protein